MIVTRETRLQTAEHENTRARQGQPYYGQADSHIRVTVLFTTPEGTRAALSMAQDLAKNLGLHIALVAIQAVPFHFPLDQPPVSIDFLEQRLLALVANSRIAAEEIRIKLCFCRDYQNGLQQLFVANSLVVVGGRKRWWRRQDRKLEQHLRSLGQRVIFVDVKSKSKPQNAVQSLPYSF